jgi:hypothetical protein
MAVVGATTSIGGSPSRAPERVDTSQATMPAPEGTHAPLADEAVWTAGADPSVASVGPDPQDRALPPARVWSPVSWKTLVLVYRDSDVSYEASDGSVRRFRSHISDADMALQLSAVRGIGPTVASWSGGRGTLDVDIVEVDRPLDHVDRLVSGEYWYGPSSAGPDLDRFAPPGRYDSVITIWQAWDANGAALDTNGWGLTVPPGPWANGAGYSSVLVPRERWWITGRAHPAEVFVHEWLHQSLGFFAARGYRDLPDLHKGADYGYHDDAGSWRHWYEDVLTGQVPVKGGTTGLSTSIWRSGRPTQP